ncbi:MAG: cytochrome c3 family protein [Candidatus Marinimicrobia bacterium]|nr:cytochrome c3 family protein [Candidatus Neomarinimicrobiota bacterium]
MKNSLLLLMLMISALSGFGQDQQEFSTDLACDVCHSSGDWTKNAGQAFEHLSTGFELLGAHRDIECSRCHTGSNTVERHDFSRVIDECSSCHEDVHRDQWGQDCERCHDSDSWVLPTIFQNHDLTRFPLQGAHQNQSCEGCHMNNPGKKEILPLDCWGCHEKDYVATRNPDHLDSGFPRSCDVCHSQNDWMSRVVDHDKTRFPLRGAHIQVDCESCHSTGYSISTSCESCHQSTYSGTQNPNHQNYGYPEYLCEACHNSTSWEPSIFTHNVISLECASCHGVEYSATSEPPHELMSIPNTCADCHTSNAWVPSEFEHSEQNTGFPLQEAHTEVICQDCHTTWVSASEPRTCYYSSCHLSAFQETNDPDHELYGYPGNYCESCHSQTAWDPAIFSHNLPSIECVTCHLVNYSATAQPPHETVTFSQNCAECHSTATWVPSQFPHDLQTTGFLLEGAHLSTDCQQCHSTWESVSVPRTCADASCHLPDYQATINPDHEAVSFPLDCTECHSSNAWTPATFDHDGLFFPIYSGKHNNEWNECSQCHINSMDYSAFTCFGSECHTMTRMNDKHCEGSSCESCNGLTYQANLVTPDDCYSCHPTGDEDDCKGSSDSFYPPDRWLKPTESNQK